MDPSILADTKVAFIAVSERVLESQEGSEFSFWRIQELANALPDSALEELYNLFLANGGQEGTIHLDTDAWWRAVYKFAIAHNLYEIDFISKSTKEPVTYEQFAEAMKKIV